jgi:hypothetical protein
MPSYTGVGREEIKKDGKVKVIKGNISVVRKQSESQAKIQDETMVKAGDIIWWVDKCEWEFISNVEGLQ